MSELADQLTEIAVKVEACKTMLERRHYPGSGRPEKERGALFGECLAHRLSILYLVEDHWGEIIDALRSVDSGAKRG